MSNGALRVIGWVIVAAGAAIGVIRYVNGSAPERTADGLAAALALGAVVAAPGALVLLGVQGRPLLLIPAAVALVPLSFLSFALVTLPLLVPAVLLWRAAAARSIGVAMRDLAVVVAATALLAVAVLALFASEDPRQAVTATTVHGSSDVISWVEAAASLACTAAALGLASRCRPAYSLASASS